MATTLGKYPEIVSIDSQEVEDLVSCARSLLNVMKDSPDWILSRERLRAALNNLDRGLSKVSEMSRKELMMDASHNGGRVPTIRLVALKTMWTARGIEPYFCSGDYGAKVTGDKLPFCTEECPSHDGKRCDILGRRPGYGLCQPAIADLIEQMVE